MNLGKIGLAGLVLAMAVVALAEEKRPDSPALSMPGSEGSVSITTKGPDEARVGESYGYDILVKNTTNDTTLRNVVVRQQMPEGFQIEKSDPKADPGEGDEKKDDQESRRRGVSRWTLDQLGPGETKTIHVTAVADKEGSLANCLSVTYTPSVCLTTRFVKPEIQLTKMVPQEASICQPLEFVYQVRNTGSGTSGNLVIQDDLAEGLKTADGKDSLTIDVGQVKAGDTREFRTQLFSDRAGQLGSRAEVFRADDKGPQRTPLARSAFAATRLTQAKLEIALKGPEAEYLQRPISYVIQVLNRGDAPAMGTQLHVHLDEAAQLASASNPRLLDEATPSPGAKPEETGRNPVLDVRPTWDRDDKTLTWRLGTIPPHDSVLVRATVIGTDKKTLENHVEASYDCRSKIPGLDTTARQVARTEIIALPALTVAVGDDRDPVPVGDEVIYTVTVMNEGNAADENVRVTAQVPNEEEFLNASGETPVKAEGNKLTFDPIGKLDPGKRAVWQVHTRPKSTGNVRFHVELLSQSLPSPATAEEPTNLAPAEQAVVRGSGEKEEPREARRPEPEKPQK